MNPFSDLDAILQDGQSFQYSMPEYGAQNVTISTHEIGHLILTSGKLLTWDLFMIPDDRYSLKQSLTPGYYPIVVSVAHFQPTGDTRIACAILRISEARTVRWEAAAINEPNTERTEERYGYPVDSGTGSFMDVEAAQILSQCWQQSGDEAFEKYCDKVIAEMDRHSFGKHSTAGWANMEVNTTKANVITFSSGWGDGDYASFWGYDASGNLTSLVTDFDLFYEG